MARKQKQQKQKKQGRIVETTYGTPTNVDSDNGVIEGVKILGEVSKNGRRYSRAAMESAAEKYDQIKVQLNHPDRKNPNAERRVEDTFGELRNVTVKDDGVYGDLHYLKSHPHAQPIAEMAERMPNQLGMSHNAEGNLVQKGDEWVVESLDSVRSVDVVANPATNKGLYESEQPRRRKRTMKLLEYLGRIPKGTKGKARFLEMVAGDEEMAELEMPEESPIVPTEEEIAAAPELGDATVSGDDMMLEALRTMIMEKFDDSTLDLKGTIAAIKDVLSKHPELVPGESGASEGGGEGGGEASEGGEGGGEEEEELAESYRQQMRDNNKLLLEGFGIPATPARVNVLMACGSDQAAKRELLEGWKGATGGGRVPRPSRSSSVLEGHHRSGSAFESLKEEREAVFGKAA